MAWRNLLELSLADSDKKVHVPYTMVVGVYPPLVESAGCGVLLTTGGVVQAKELQMQVAKDVDTMIERNKRTVYAPRQEG